MNATATKPEIFTVWSDEILKNRIDAYFYQPKFKELYEVLKRGDYKVGSLAEIFDGELVKGILPSQEEKDGDVKVVQISSIQRDGTIDTSDCITAKRETYNEKHALLPDDILVVITGATIGKVGLWKETKADFYLGGDIVKFQVKKSFDPMFLWAYLRSEFGQKQILRHITGATNKHLAPADVSSIQIPFLSIDKQRKIAKIIQTAYAEKRKKEEEIKKILASIDDFVLGELGIEIPRGEGAEQVYEVWSDEIEGRIDPYFYLPKFEKLYEQIKRYKKVEKLKDIVDELDYGLMPTQDYAESESSGVPMIRVTNITSEGDIDMSDVKYIPFDTPRLDEKRVKENDILMVQCGSTTGKAAIVPKQFENYTFGSFSFVIRGKKSEITQDYLFAVLMTSLIQEQIKRTWNIVTVRPNTSKPAVENLLVPVPPLSMQKEIGEFVQSSYAKVRALRAEAAEVLANAQKQVEQMILA